MSAWFRKSKQPPRTPVPPEWTLSAHWAARARWISHVTDFLGDPTNEWSPGPGMQLLNRPEFLVLEFGPREGRDHFTYLTAGLGLYPQLAAGAMPNLEITACTQSADARVAQLVFMLAHDIASAQANEAAFKAFDLWGAEMFGLRDFVLVPAREDAALLDFPNRAARPEDERYLVAATGEVDGEMALNLLQLVPLTPDEWREATEQGSRALLDRIDWAAQPKTHGWSAMSPAGG